MTDISTQQQPLTVPSSLARILRHPLTLLKYLFRSRRRFYLDRRHANAHLLKDLGLSRTHGGPPLPSSSRLW
ncbi:hypothetical protein BOA8489_04026 [Boseongicola aestuarii]|uniref:DUF1127 domain-containing protein n=1 Tax=Boseongicola aestuarii TaxID=1470561 RepID=A0A238J6B2_9RHOB|nr:hypothetical protein BOA8489_04026 [Boseongicola aestuarii]